MRLTFTPTVRANDAAIVAAGSVFGITVPPRQTDFQYQAVCSSKCSSKVRTIVMILVEALCFIYVVSQACG